METEQELGQTHRQTGMKDFEDHPLADISSILGDLKSLLLPRYIPYPG